jgi:hypothetical protein
MSQGLNTRSSRFLQMIPETAAGTFDPSAAPLITSNLQHEWQDGNAFDGWRSPGMNEDEFNALIEGTQIVSGEFVPFYNLLDDTLLPYVFALVSNALDTGVRTRVYELPASGLVNRKTFSLEEGVAASCRRATYGLIPSFSITSQRGNGGKCRGQVSMMLRAATEGVAMTGAVAQNEIWQFIAAGVTENAVFALPTTPKGAGGNLTIAPGETSGTLKTKLNGIVGYNDAGVLVTGSIPVGNEATGATVIGSNVNTFGLSANLFDGNDTTSFGQDGGGGVWATCDFGNANKKAIQRIVLWAANTNINQVIIAAGDEVEGDNNQVPIPGFSQTFNLVPSDWVADPTHAGLYKHTFDFVNATAYRYTGFAFLGSAGTNARTAQMALNSLGITGTLTVTLGGALANSNIGEPTKTSGAGWSLDVQQQGSNSEVTRVTALPILPNHWRISRATNYANIGDVGSIIGVAQRLEWANENLVAPYDREITYSDHVDGEPQISIAFAVGTEVATAPL